MLQQDQSTQPVADSKPLWETPELVVADVSSATLAGGANNIDGGGTLAS